MKANARVVITGERVTLVPYEKEHVPKYHNWMKDPWLQGELNDNYLTLIAAVHLLQK